SNYRTNFVPYQVTKDTFSILPSDSVIMTFGDNASYQGWYLKLIGRYREDVCQMSSADQEKIAWMLQGCSRKIYASVFPTFFSEKFTEIVPMIQKHRFYGTDPVKENGAYKKYLYSSGYSQPLYTINVTKKNRPYLECSDHLLRFNQWPILYLREKE